jgi:hypothetical protein
VPEDEDEPYVPSVAKCSRNGQPYNAILFPNPASIVHELRQLGFGSTVAPSNLNPLSAAWKAEIKKFQALARSLNLSGFVSAPADAIDGFAGPCTLLAMEEAHKARLSGVWPYQLVT